MRMQHHFIFAGQADMKNLGLRMIDPDDGVKMGRHASPSEAANCHSDPEGTGSPYPIFGQGH
jgi:hypothetical protein